MEWYFSFLFFSFCLFSFPVKTTIITSADLSLKVQDTALVPIPGEEIAYGFNVFNYGPSDARNATISIYLPNYFTFNRSNENLHCVFKNGDQRNLSCNFGTFSFENGYTELLEIFLILSPSFQNSANITTNFSISSLEQDRVPSNNYDSTSRKADRQVDILTQLSALKRLDLDTTVVAGTNYITPTYTFVNNGPSVASGLYYRLELNVNQLANEAVSFVSATGVNSESVF